MSTLPKGFTFVDDDDTDETPEVVQQQTGLPAGMAFVEEEYVPPAEVEKAVPEYTPAEERIETVREELPTEPTSMKSLVEDDELVADILQYRQDRFGVEKDVKAANIVFGRAGFNVGDISIGGGQELTNENVVDDLMDHYRFMTQNSMNAASEISWLNSLKDKEADAIAQANASSSPADQKRYTDQANEFAEQRERALRLYKRAENVGSLFNSKRYKEMSGMEAVGDIVDAVGGNVLAVMSDPLTVVTAGVGRYLSSGLSAAGMSPIKAGIIAAARTAPVEAGGAAVVDILVQNAEIEMGARDSIDYTRTATVSGVSGLTAGAMSGVGTRNAAKKVSIGTRGQLDAALKEMRKTQLEAAKKANDKHGIFAEDVRENLAKGLTDIYGDDVIIRNKDGVIKAIDSEVIKKSPNAQSFFEKVEVDGRMITAVDEDIIQPEISFDIFERVTASMGDMVAGLKDGSLKLVDNVDSNLTLKDLTGPLTKTTAGKERVSERMLNIMSNVTEDSMDEVISIMGKYGVTKREVAAAMFADASRAGRTLGNLSALQKKFVTAGSRRTAADIAEAADADAASAIGNTWRRLEDIRRLTLVSGVATAARNNISQVLRSGVDTLVYSFESAINPNKKYSFNGSLAQLKHTFFDPGDAGTVAKFMLDAFPDQRMRFYNQYSEISNKLATGNPGQNALSKQSGGVAKENPILDTWENAIHHVNILNRFQEAVYRNGAFTASIQRQLYDKGVDMVDVLKQGTLTRDVTEDMVAKATDDALEFTYASQPKTAMGRLINNFIVQSGLTTVIPFPRFMIKAMEFTYNYNVTGAGTALFRYSAAKLKGEKVTDEVYRQFAEGIAGGLPLITLGYMLRDRENDMAGSEWYMLKDGMGNEFDARPFFPLTPYLLIGEMLHRGTIPIEFFKDPNVLKETSVKEMLEGFTGTNFRGSGPISMITEDLLSETADPLDQQDTYNNLGRYVGEMVSGYGQPIWQIADAASLFTDMNQRQKDYAEDPKYRDGVTSFFNGMWRPIKLRGGKIAEELGEAFGFELADTPEKEDPRFEETKERVMPFMKLMFGATLERVPPKYVMELYDLGFDYRNFMTRTSSPRVDRAVNREMGIAMNMEIPEVLATAREEGLSAEETSALTGKWITRAKSMIRAEMKLADEDTVAAANISKFRGQPQASKRAAMDAFEQEYGREVDMFKPDEVLRLLDYTKTHGRYAKQRQ